MSTASIKTGLRGAILAPLAGAAVEWDHSEFEPLAAYQDKGNWRRSVQDAIANPEPDDRILAALASEWKLDPIEIAAATLALLVEEEAWVGRALARLQSPLGGSRPLVALLAEVFGEPSGGRRLISGEAAATGLIQLSGEANPLPERIISMPLPVALALRGEAPPTPEIPAVPLAPATLAGANRLADTIGAGHGGGIVIRCRSLSEGRAVAIAIGERLHLSAAFSPLDRPPSAAWLRALKRMPVHECDLAPGQTRELPVPHGYRGPSLALCGPDGSLSAAMPLIEWTMPVPPREQRIELWRQAGLNADEARELAAHRHAEGRIASMGALIGRTRPMHESHEKCFRAASWHSGGRGLEGFAVPVRIEVSDQSFVAEPKLQQELDLLLDRCRFREDLANELGICAATRYQPGLRALLTGPSGTGKTLAAAYVATSLGMPLYRVDLAAITSKYIGETEKNLAQLLARAEESECILLFDEADSLFGRRTDIRDSNDRFANAQTNYLLQRIETFDSIAILTSNSLQRFDPAFLRRLDFVIEFPNPAAPERRDLWKSHLGDGHTLTPDQLGLLAAAVDLAGGHIRNAVLLAAVSARRHSRKLNWGDLMLGIRAEYRKLGQIPPPDLEEHA